MKINTLINLITSAAVILSLSLSVSLMAAEKSGSVSAAIQVTARVVSSLGVAAAPIEMEMPEENDYGDWWLWMPDNEDLQIQIQADGQFVESLVLDAEPDPGEISALDRHRHNGLSRNRLQVESLPAGTATCTVTIVNPAN